MIRYDISLTDLTTAVELRKPGWTVRADHRTATFRASGRCNEKVSIWSEVKPVYMGLQGNKCAYCERKMESVTYGKAEQDTDHFRPKRNIKHWHARKSLTVAGVQVTPAPAAHLGYYLLTYHLYNYAAACTPCNRVIKSYYFPISGLYDLQADDPSGLAASERSLLIYPIGNIDDDPESLIKFTGLSPQARLPAGFGRQRALVTIDFFKLDDATGREDLFRDRAMILMGLYEQLKKMTGLGTTQEKGRAKAIVNKYLASTAPHANCARSFASLFASDPDMAYAFFKRAEDFVLSCS